MLGDQNATRIAQRCCAVWATGFCALVVSSASAAASTRDDSRTDPPGTWGDVVRSTAAIAEGDVTGVSYLYDDQYGPRTLTTLENIQCHRGALPAYDKLTLSVLGGYTDSGTFLEASHTPSFVVGSRVLVFLTNRPWFLAPVPWGWSFRIMEHRGRKVVVTEGGAAVVGIGSFVPEFGGMVATFDELASGARGVDLARTSAAETALAVDQFLSVVDTVGLQRGIALSGALDMNPKLAEGGRWDIVPVAKPAPLMCDEPLMSPIPRQGADKLVCDGGGI